MKTKDWKTLAIANGVELSGAELERVLEPLRKLDDTFRPLVADLTAEVEPVTVFHVEETGA